MIMMIKFADITYVIIKVRISHRESRFLIYKIIVF